jgi:sialic acid synthase SpsE
MTHYPASSSNTNSCPIPQLHELCGCAVGLSDHTKGIGISMVSVTSGATVIVKHFTFRRGEGGVDSALSLETEKLKALVVETEIAFRAMEPVQLDTQKSEKKIRQFKRSIYVVKDIKAGKPFTTDNIRVIRPGDGLEPKYFDMLLGLKVNRNVKKKFGFAMDDDWIAASIITHDPHLNFSLLHLIIKALNHK